MPRKHLLAPAVSKKMHPSQTIFVRAAASCGEDSSCRLQERDRRAQFITSFVENGVVGVAICRNARQRRDTSGHCDKPAHVGRGERSACRSGSGCSRGDHARRRNLFAAHGGRHLHRHFYRRTFPDAQRVRDGRGSRTGRVRRCAHAGRAGPRRRERRRRSRAGRGPFGGGHLRDPRRLDAAGHRMDAVPERGGPVRRRHDGNDDGDAARRVRLQG